MARKSLAKVMAAARQATEQYMVGVRAERIEKLLWTKKYENEVFTKKWVTQGSTEERYVQEAAYMVAKAPAIIAGELAETLPGVSVTTREVRYNSMYCNHYKAPCDGWYYTVHWKQEGLIQLANWLGEWPKFPATKAQATAAIKSGGVVDKSYSTVRYGWVPDYYGFTVLPGVGAVLGERSSGTAEILYDGGTVLVAEFDSSINKERTVSARNQRRVTDVIDYLCKGQKHIEWTVKEVLRKARRLLPKEQLAELLETLPQPTAADMEYTAIKAIYDDNYYDYVRVNFVESGWSKDDWINCSDWLGEWPGAVTQEHRMTKVAVEQGLREEHYMDMDDRRNSFTHYRGFRIIPGIGAVLGLNGAFTSLLGVAVSRW